MFEFQFSQAGQVDLQPGPFDFWSTCDAVKAEVLPAALAKGVQFRWSVEATGGACHVDGDKLNRSVVNLLKIAVDRAPAGETVHLSLTESDQDLEVLIHGIWRSGRRAFRGSKPPGNHDGRTHERNGRFGHGVVPEPRHHRSPWGRVATRDLSGRRP